MPETTIEEEYQKILEQKGVVSAAGDGPGSERRVHPRLTVESPDLWISTVPEFELLDMSATGMAIRSNHPMKVDEMFHVSLGQNLSVDTIVVGCQMVHSADEYTDGEFRIQARFVENLKGMELLVKAIRGN